MDKQNLAIAELCTGWLEKASVGCLIVGMFQPDHIFGGLIGATIFFVAALVVKVRTNQ